MESGGEKKENDTLLEMGSMNCVKDAPNAVQMKRMHADGNTSGGGLRSPDDVDDNENTSTLDNEIIDDACSSSSSEEDEVSHVLDPNSCKGKIAVVMKSNFMQYFVIAMVIVDCLIIIFELLIDMEFIKFSEDAAPNNTVIWEHTTEAHTSHDQHSDHDIFHNSSHHIGNDNHSDHSSDHHHHEHHHTKKEQAEHILHAMSLSILSLFMVEVSLKIYVEGKHLLRQKAEVFDAVVVIVSFTLDIVFSFVSVESAAKDAAGLMVLLRLWRVTRIINGVILSVKMEAKKKSDALKKIIRQLEHENRRQRSRLDKLEKENALLRQQLVELNGGSTAVLRALIKVSHAHHHHHHHNHDEPHGKDHHKGLFGHGKSEAHNDKKDSHKHGLFRGRDSDKDSDNHEKDTEKTVEDLEKEHLTDSHDHNKKGHKFHFHINKKKDHGDDGEDKNLHH